MYYLWIDHLSLSSFQGSRFRGLTMGFPPLPQRSTARRSFGRSKRLSLARSLDDLEVGAYVLIHPSPHRTHTQTQHSCLAASIRCHARLILMNLVMSLLYCTSSTLLFLQLGAHMLCRVVFSHHCGNISTVEERPIFSGKTQHMFSGWYLCIWLG